MRRLCVFACVIICLSTGSGCQSTAPTPSKREVRIAAAADLKFALDELIGEFKRQNPGIAITATYGSSGNFFAQLGNRAPFDLYLSADIDYPRQLAEKQLGIKETLFTYAVGHLVLWAPNQSPVNVEKLGLDALLDPAVKKIAIANARYAPYGRAAEAALKKLDLYERIKDKLVQGENVMQTAQFVESGAADVGLIPLSLAMAPALRDKGHYCDVPADAYPRLEQGGVILSWAQDREAADVFRSFMTGAEGKAMLRRFGFGVPGN